MNDFTPEQIKKIKQLSGIANVIDNGDVGVAEEIVSLHDDIEQANEKIVKLEEDTTFAVESVKELAVEALKIAQDTSKKELPTPYTPKKGVDYFDGQDYVLTESDKADIAKKIKVPVVDRVIERTTETITRETPVITEITKEIKVENTVTGEEIIDKVNSLPVNTDEFKIDASHIKNLPKGGIFEGRHNNLGHIIRGLVAGSNITIDTTNPQYPVISSTGGGSGSGYQEPLTGSVDGSNRTFTWTTAPNALLVDGSGIMKTPQNDTVGWTGTTTTILTVAPNYSICAIA